MKTASIPSDERYLKEQIAIMTALLAQMADGYAMARIRIQLCQLESALHPCQPT